MQLSLSVTVIALINLLSFVPSSSVHASPVAEHASSHNSAAVVKASVKQDASAQSPPHWVVYSDAWVGGSTGLVTPAEIQGWNVVNLGVWLLADPWDNVEQWTTLSSSQRSSLLSNFTSAGVKVIVSVFESTDEPTTSGADPTATANEIASFVKQYDLQGVDVDYEDFDAFNAGTAEAWLITFTKALRAQLPSPQYIITHAPVAPWFAPNMWTGGGYLAVDQAVGSLIDWYNVQFYNQGTSEYTTCSGLLTQSSSAWPESALFQIAANGVSLNKLVIGKPGASSDATNGYVSPSTLASCVSQAKAQGWSAGVMSWEYPDANAAWIKTVRGSAFPE